MKEFLGDDFVDPVTQDDDESLIGESISMGTYPMTTSLLKSFLRIVFIGEITIHNSEETGGDLLIHDILHCSGCYRYYTRIIDDFALILIYFKEDKED